MRALVLVAGLFLAGCQTTIYETVYDDAAINNTIQPHSTFYGLKQFGIVPQRYADGYRSYDPCITCGEEWDFGSHPSPHDPATYVE